MCTSAICYYFYVASETILDCELNSKIIAFQPLAYYIPPLSPPSGALLFLQNTSFFMSADDPLALVLCIFFLHRSNLFVSLVSSACRVARPHQMTVDILSRRWRAWRWEQVIHIGQMVISSGFIILFFVFLSPTVEKQQQQEFTLGLLLIHLHLNLLWIQPDPSVLLSSLFSLCTLNMNRLTYFNIM